MTRRVSPIHCLVPLADNGGPTWTHAPLVGSLAIDRGSSTAVAGSGGVPMFDQRGAPYTRVYNGDGVGGARIDIGALELQPIVAPALPGDYNSSGTVDAADYAAWRNAMGSNVTPYSGADGDGSGIVDQADYGVWRAHFGLTLATATETGTSAFTTNAVPAASQFSKSLPLAARYTIQTAAHDFVSPESQPPAAVRFPTANKPHSASISARRDELLAVWFTTVEVGRNRGDESQETSDGHESPGARDDIYDAVFDEALDLLEQME